MEASQREGGKQKSFWLVNTVTRGPCVMSKSEVSEVHSEESEQESEEMIPNLCFKKRQHGKRQLRPLSGPVTLLSLVTDNRQHATESLMMPEPWPLMSVSLSDCL